MTTYPDFKNYKRIEGDYSKYGIDCYYEAEWNIFPTVYVDDNILLDDDDDEFAGEWGILAIHIDTDDGWCNTFAYDWDKHKQQWVPYVTPVVEMSKNLSNFLKAVLNYVTVSLRT